MTIVDFLYYSYYLVVRGNWKERIAHLLGMVFGVFFATFLTIYFHICEL